MEDDTRSYATTHTLTMKQIAELAQLKIWLGVNASEIVRQAIDLLYEETEMMREAES